MSDKNCDEIMYFEVGTQIVIKESVDKDEKLQEDKKKYIDIKFSNEIYQREISYSKVIGHVEEQD